jgi:hypothetical protein
MGFLSSVWKGVKGIFSPPKQQVSTQPVSNYTPEQDALFRNLISANPKYTGGNVPSSWWYQQSQPTSQESGFLKTLENYSQTAGNKLNQIHNPSTLKSIYGEQSYLNAFRPQAYSQIFDPQAAMSRVMDRFNTVSKPQWMQDVAPLIRSEYAGPNYWGSARANAVTRSLNDLYRGAQSEMFDVGNQWDANKANALAGLEGTRAQSIINNDLSAKGVYSSNEQARQQALQVLLGQEPGLAQEAAKFSRELVERQNPYTDPAYLEALKLLGLDPITVMGGVTEKGAGIGYGLLNGIAKGAGTVIGGKIG